MAARRAITSFTSGDIYAFDWARDGRLVYSRGLISADVILIHDRNAGREDDTRKR